MMKFRNTFFLNFIFIFSFTIIFGSIFYSSISNSYSTTDTKQLVLPKGLIKIQEYNKSFAEKSQKNISFAVAFIAGVLTILSPCILPILPAYFSYTFKEKKEITKKTLIFFLGFAVVFIIFGVVASLLGSMTIFVTKPDILVYGASIILILMGIFIFFGIGFENKLFNRFNFKSDSTFLNGSLFAIGWSACVGPILSAILSIAVILGDVFLAIYLMFFYSLGILVPLFLFSIYFDKYRLYEKKFFRGKIFKWKFFGRSFFLNLNNMISGIMLVIVGILFIINNETGIINGLTAYVTKNYFYTVQSFFEEWKFTNIVGGIFLVGFLYLLFLQIFRKKK